MEKKFCKGCEETLPISNFGKSKNVKDGYENKCRECRKKARMRKHIYNCLYCKETFSATKKQKYCSPKCRSLSRRRRVNVSCSYCEETVEIIPAKLGLHEHYYCNQKCRTEHLKALMEGENNPNYNRVDYKCDGCGVVFKVIPSKVQSQKYIFCNAKCYKENIGKYFLGENNWNYNRQNYKCDTCGEEFTRIPSQVKGLNKYCSKECHIVAIRNAPAKTKVTVKCCICEKEMKVWRAKLKYIKRFHCSKKCARISYSIYYSGSNSPRWNPELTEEERLIERNYPEYRKWRNKVFKRDNYTCQCCGDEQGGNLVAHHILNYSEYEELRTDVDNGITLCGQCHKEFHDTFGYTNNDEQQLQMFLMNYIKTPITL